MRYFLLVCAFLFASCSRKSAEQLYSEGVKAENEKQYPVAVENYKEIIDRYEQSPLADSAMYRLALVYNNDLHETEHAVQTYKLYHQKFNSNPRAATALFLAAFLMNNDLHQTDSARVAYEKFLQMYPDHQLAQSAKFELTNLGKDPDQFIPQTSTEAQETTAAVHPHRSK